MLNLLIEEHNIKGLNFVNCQIIFILNNIIILDFQILKEILLILLKDYSIKSQL